MPEQDWVTGGGSFLKVPLVQGGSQPMAAPQGESGGHRCPLISASGRSPLAEPTWELEGRRGRGCV